MIKKLLLNGLLFMILGVAINYCIIFMTKYWGWNKTGYLCVPELAQFLGSAKEGAIVQTILAALLGLIIGLLCSIKQK